MARAKKTTKKKPAKRRATPRQVEAPGMGATRNADPELDAMANDYLAWADEHGQISAAVKKAKAMLEGALLGANRKSYTCEDGTVITVEAENKLKVKRPKTKKDKDDDGEELDF